MAVSPGYQTFVLDQLGRVLPAVRARRMFGGVGLYADDLFFALIDDDTLYLKVDDANRADFEARGMGPFQPYGEGTPSMQYYQLPEEIFEDAHALTEWAQRALDVARRAKATRAAGKAGTKTKRPPR
jgi:DNA transformation protein